MVPFVVIALAIIILDIATKTVVRGTMALGSEISILPFFSLVHIENTGIAFGMFANWNLVFIFVGLIVTGVMIRFGLQMLRTDRPSAFAIAAIVGGAVGNLVDRILKGRVTDFLDVFVGAHHWPAFNVADAAICVGAAFIAVRSFGEGRR